MKSGVVVCIKAKDPIRKEVANKEKGIRVCIAILLKSFLVMKSADSV